ncbi:MAG TPA: radical SAM protein [Planctomycetota bacterium]|nr:radical SAM protein [Planctomycetota bacterium]
MRHLTGLAKWIRLWRARPRSRGAPLPLGFILSFLKRLRHDKLTELDDVTYISYRYPPLESPARRTSRRGLERIRAGERPLMTLCVATTSRCPMRCVYCSAENYPDAPDMSTSRLRSLVAEAQDLGAYAIDFSGGEPLLRPDLPEVVAAVDDRSVTVLSTSGFNFPEMSRDLRRAGLDYVVVSLDSFDARVNNERRGHPDATGIAVKAVRAAVREGFYTALNMVADETMLEPGAFEAYLRAAQALGVHEVSPVAPRACVRLGRHRFRGFTPAQVDRLRRLQVRFNRMTHLPTVTSLDYAESYYGCPGGSMHCYVSAAGDVTPCPGFPVSFGNVNDQPLAEVYENMRRHIRQPFDVCPLTQVFRLLEDVPDEALPVPDAARVERVFRELNMESRPIPAFWRQLGLRKDG